ncbi:MAG: hypothetical protein LUC33_05375, partial [Prevotellaceae bacterium]|nr:hypothetical protein [Prevotellaceae bacterium]
QASYRDGKGFPVTMDIYALGGTMFKMLTGQRPPDASDIFNFGFPSDELRKAGVSPWLVSLVGKCMEPAMMKRPQSADEVLGVLRKQASSGEETVLGEDEPIVAEVVEIKPKPKRKPLLVPISIAVACLVAIGIVAAFLLKPKHTPSDEALALADTVAGDTPTLPDQPVSDVVEPEEQPEEPEKTEKEEVVTPAATQDTQETQETQATQPSKPSVKVSSPSGTINGHGYVDLGLSVKWATCNVGASSPSEYGNYYAWGETSTKSSYDEDNCKTYNVSMGSIAGNSSYDAARANWGGTWRLPTANEIDEMVNKCTTEWTSINGVRGRKVTGPSGNSIFLPDAGDRYGKSLIPTGGYYWSATPNESGTQNAYNLYFNSDIFSFPWGADYRFYGFSVRPVSD